MMRKILILIVLLTLSMTVIKAQDKAAQAPIIAIAEKKLYLVSPEDSSTTLLAEPQPDQSIAPLLMNSISPDGKQFIYTIQSNFDTQNPYVSDLFLVTIADGTTQTISPSGGLFDLPSDENERVVLNMPAWSADGQRIYYYRSIYNTRALGVVKPILFAYYDIASGKHELVSRLDPKNLLDNLQGIAEGMIVRWYAPGFTSTTTSVLYAPDNHIVKQVEMDAPYVYALHDKEGMFYAQLKDFGDIDFMVNANTGEKKTLEDRYYPAMQSLTSGENSMHVFSTQSDINTYYVYGTDYHTPITSMDNSSGFGYSLSPDGQHMAYIRFANQPQATIQIVDINGNMSKLAFSAEQILWGATEFVPFYAPDVKPEIESNDA